MVSPRKLEANRRNAQKSMGPRTPEGKARSRLNAVTHGMTGRTLILPGEDGEEYQRRLDTWTALLRPCNPFEEEMVRKAVDSSWRLDRADRVRTGCLADRIAADDDEEDGAGPDSVIELGRRLWADPAPETPPAGPDDPDDPARLVIRLETTADGCRWLLDRWADLRRAIDDGRAWSPSETVRAIRLLGKRLQDADYDPEVLAVLAACWMLDPECPHPFTTPGGRPASPEIRSRREWLLARRIGETMPATEERAREVLRQVVDEATGPLASLEPHRRDREEAQAAERAASRRYDDTPEGDRLRRFQLRDTRTVIRTVERLHDARQKGYELPKPPPEPGPPSLPQDPMRRLQNGAPDPQVEPDEAPPPSGPEGPAPHEIVERIDAAGDPSEAQAAAPPTPIPPVAPASRPRRPVLDAILSTAMLSAFLLVLSCPTPLIPVGSDPDADRPEVSAPIDDAQDQVSPADHPRAGISDTTPPLGPGLTPAHTEKRQNEPTDEPVEGPSRVEWPRRNGPADRSRGPPASKDRPSTARQPSSSPPETPGPAAPRARAAGDPDESPPPAGPAPAPLGLLSEGPK